MFLFKRMSPLLKERHRRIQTYAKLEAVARWTAARLLLQ